MTGSFLQEPPVSPRVWALYNEDLADGGYVWKVPRLWAIRLGAHLRLRHAPPGLAGLLSQES